MFTWLRIDLPFRHNPVQDWNEGGYKLRMEAMKNKVLEEENTKGARRIASRMNA